MGIKEIASQLSKSKSTAGGNYITQGRGRLIIKSMTVSPKYAAKLGRECDTFLAEFTVESSDSTEVDAEGNEIPPNKVGSDVSFMQQFEAQPQTSFPAVKALILAVDGKADGEVSEEEFSKNFEMAVSAQQPLRGVAIDYQTYNKIAKGSGKPLVLPRWKNVPGQNADSIAANRAKLDGKTAA